MQTAANKTGVCKEQLLVQGCCQESPGPDKPAIISSAGPAANSVLYYIANTVK